MQRQAEETGGYTYTVLYKKKSSDVWTVKQKLSENTKVEITPAVQTDYKICVKVIDSSGEVVKKYFNLKVNHELQNNSVISRTTVPYGESLKVYGRAEGGIGKYLYAVYYKKASDTNWTTKQKYDRNTVVPIKPAAATDYNVCIKIKDEQGTVAKKYFDFNVKVDYTKEVFRLTNEERQKEGLAALASDDRLMAAAQQRAEEIAESFGHARPDGRSCFTILSEYNISYWAAAENIANGYRTPESVIDGWMNSEGHRNNMLNANVTHMGVGFFEKNGKKYWVQIFARLR